MPNNSLTQQIYKMTLSKSNIENKVGAVPDWEMSQKIKFEAIEVAANYVAMQWIQGGKTYSAHFEAKPVFYALHEIDVIDLDTNQFGFIQIQERKNDLQLTDTYVKVLDKITPSPTAHKYIRMQNTPEYKGVWKRLYSFKELIRQYANDIVLYALKNYPEDIQEDAIFTEEEVRHVEYVHPRQPVLTAWQMSQLGMC